MPVTKQKATGAHFTPPELARLVAERVVSLISSLNGPLRVLDPACGGRKPAVRHQ
jgi:type I restriction-modification system DNA methylase subunit